MTEAQKGEIKFAAGNGVEVALTGGGNLRIRCDKTSIVAVLDDDQMRKLATALNDKAGDPDCTEPERKQGVCPEG